MRAARLGLAIIAAGALVWPSGTARAQDHDYYVVAVGDEQAVLIDRATRARTGNIVTLDVIVLQKQPSTVTGQQTYWVDGVQEIDCTGHRTRLMLIAALPLDRSRKFNSPNAAFRPWTANAPGTDTRAVEDFVCREGSSPGIRMVADLTAFQRRFFNGEAGLADRGERSIADTRAALQAQRQGAAPAPSRAPPQQQQRPPPEPPPMSAQSGGAYYAFSRADERVQLINREQIVRGQGFATAPSIILLRTPIREGGREYYWIDATVQFECAANRVRTRVQATYTLDRASRSEAQGSQFSDWTPVGPGSAGADVQGLVCYTNLAPGVRSVTDLSAFQRNYFAATAPSGPGPAPTPRAAPAAAPPPQSSRTSPTSPPTTSAAPTGRLRPWYVINNDTERASLVATTDAVRVGDIVTALYVMLLIKPEKAAGEDVYWLDGLMQVDCVRHQSRTMLTAGRPLDRNRRTAYPNPAYKPWLSIRAGDATVDAETLLCANRAPAGAIPVDDLSAFQKQFYAFAAQKKK